MEKLAEREVSPRTLFGSGPALAVQFFVIPLAVVAITVLVYAGFRMMVTDERTAQDYLREVRTGGENRRWPAAYELSRLMADPKVRASDSTLVPELVKAFAESRDDDPRVRQYLALALGRLDPPAPPEALRLLTEALRESESDTKISVIWALGSLGDASVAPRLEEVFTAENSDPGLRKMAVYALGALPGVAQERTLETALNDPAADVRWNAAIGLARHNNRAGVPVLRQMLDRGYVEQAVTRTPRPDADVDPVGDVMISGLRAVGALKEQTLVDPVRAISEQDRSMRVRQAAIDALKALGV